MMHVVNIKLTGLERTVLIDRSFIFCPYLIFVDQTMWATYPASRAARGHNK